MHLGLTRDFRVSVGVESSWLLHKHTENWFRLHGTVLSLFSLCKIIKLSGMSICSPDIKYTCTCSPQRTPRFTRQKNIRRNVLKCHTTLHTKTELHKVKMDLYGVVIPGKQQLSSCE